MANAESDVMAKDAREERDADTLDPETRAAFEASFARNRKALERLSKL